MNSIIWVLMLITFSGPYQIGQTNIIGEYTSEATCLEDQKRAIEVGLPPNTNAGCIPIKKLDIV